MVEVVELAVVAVDVAAEDAEQDENQVIHQILLELYPQILILSVS